MSRGFVLGETTAGEVLWLHPKDRTHGLYCLGVNGMGKTTFLLSGLEQDLEDGNGVVWLDPHGDATNTALDLVQANNRVDDLVFLDLQHEELAFGLNLFACQDPMDLNAVAKTAELVVGAFKRVWGDSWGPRLASLLGTVAATFAQLGLTLVQVPRFLQDDAYRAEQLECLADPYTLAKWQEYDTLSDGQRGQVIAPLLNKVDAFLRHAQTRAIVGQRESTVDFREAMANKQVVLIRLHKELEEASSLLGSVLILQFLQAAFGRRKLAPAERSLTALYADEFHNFATPVFNTLIAEARKYGIATVMAHQERGQLPAELKQGPMGTGTIVCFRLTPQDSREMDPFFPGQARGPHSPTPLAHILRHGHPNPEAVDLARRIKQGLDRQLEVRRINLAYLQSKEKEAERNATGNTYNGIWAGKAQLWLIRQIPLQWRTYNPKEYVAKIEEAIEEFLFWGMQHDPRYEALIVPLGELAEAGIKEGVLVWDGEVTNQIPQSFADTQARLNPAQQAWVDTTWRELHPFLSAVAQLRIRLAHAPIRLSADRRGAESDLLTLPKFSAKVRTQDEQGAVTVQTIRLLSYQRGLPAYRPQPAGRPWREVLAELDKPTPKPAKRRGQVDGTVFYDSPPPPFKPRN